MSSLSNSNAGNSRREVKAKSFVCFAWIGSHFNHPHCNHPGKGRERDCAGAVMWNPTELMYDSI